MLRQSGAVPLHLAAQPVGARRHRACVLRRRLPPLHLLLAQQLQPLVHRVAVCHGVVDGRDQRPRLRRQRRLRLLPRREQHPALGDALVRGPQQLSLRAQAQRLHPRRLRLRVRARGEGLVALRLSARQPRLRLLLLRVLARKRALGLHHLRLHVLRHGNVRRCAVRGSAKGVKGSRQRAGRAGAAATGRGSQGRAGEQ